MAVPKMTASPRLLNVQSPTGVSIVQALRARHAHHRCLKQGCRQGIDHAGRAQRQRMRSHIGRSQSGSVERRTEEDAELSHGGDTNRNADAGHHGQAAPVRRRLT